MRNGEWYFDFVSPYAYLQWHRLGVFRGRLELTYRPVLFAGLLDHWGQLGPAEIAPKRAHTYRHVAWLARRMGIALTLPPAHPFNPLKLLRLALFGECRPGLLDRLFAFVWRDGCLPDHARAWEALLAELGLAGAATAIEAPELKRTLREHGDRAVAAGVFGVPTVVVDGRVFWGLDATDMVLEYLADPRPLQRDEQEISRLPTAAVRPGSRR